jgi:hypothetical protein
MTFANEPLVEGVSASANVAVYPNDAYTLEWSRDGGRTWSTPKTLHIGAGTKNWRQAVRKLGKARQWTFRLKSNARFKQAINGAYAKLYNEPR